MYMSSNHVKAFYREAESLLVCGYKIQGVFKEYSSTKKPVFKGNSKRVYLIEGLRAKRAYIAFLADFHFFLQDQANFWQTDLC